MLYPNLPKRLVGLQLDVVAARLGFAGDRVFKESTHVGGYQRVARDHLR